MPYLADKLQPSRLKTLSPRLYETTQPASFPQTTFIDINVPLLSYLGLTRESLKSAGELSTLHTIATVYAGHQFGIYTSKLGDGRVHILGDVIAEDGTHWEIQLKGAGATPFARGNNGRMSLAEAITEYLGCEAMAGLGIPSTRGLAMMANLQEDKLDTDECILLRAAPSHLRFGHFEYLHNQGDRELLQRLADHVISQYYPELLAVAGDGRYLQFLYAVTERTACLVAQWQAVGFVHSVMNTDNMSLLGLTLDYGVFGFMQEYDPSYSPNPNDDQQRYAFDQQVEVARWNCLALAEALVMLLPGQRIPAVLLRHFRKTYHDAWLSLMRKKLGLFEVHQDDEKLIRELLALLQRHGVDYTRFFRCFSYVGRIGETVMTDMLPAWRTAFQPWFDRYRQRLRLEAASAENRVAVMLASNPKYILRQALLAQAIEHAGQKNDFGQVRDLLQVLQSPYAEHDKCEHLA